MFAKSFSFISDQTIPTQSGAISAALVAGGGGGGGWEAGSGGGAGGVFSPSSFTVPIGYNLSVIVGAGAAQNGDFYGLQGNNTYFHIYETAGGGAGLPGGEWDNYTSGVNGGSGSGGPLEFQQNVQTTGGLGNVPALTPVQGRNGGSGPPVGVIGGSGGGGGYGGVGGNGTATTGGAGGAGGTISPAGVAQTVAGGGGGAIWNGTRGAGGSGGGGAGGSVSSGITAGVAGLANTGGGGGGSSGYAYSSAGGSGLVKIWYSGASRATITGTGNTTATVSTFTVHTFITSGTITFSS